MGKVSEGAWSKPIGQRPRHVGYVEFNPHPHKNRKVYIPLALTGSNPVMGNTSKSIGSQSNLLGQEPL